MLVVGIHAVETFVDNRFNEIEKVLIAKSRKSNTRVLEIINKARKKCISVSFLSDCEYPQGIAAEIKLAWESVSWWNWLSQNNVQNIVILDGVQDPHNLGACMRTACAFGVDMLLIPANRAAPVNATALKVASGAGTWLPVFTVQNLNSCIKTLKQMGFWVTCLSEHAEQTLDKVAQDKKVIIVGNEQKGIRASILNSSDYIAKLPVTGPIQSLNVSVALGVALAKCLG